MNKQTNIDVAILAIADTVSKEQESSGVQCDVDFLRQKFKTAVVGFDLLLSDVRTENTLFDLFVFDATEHAFFAGGLFDTTLDPTPTQTTETYEFETDVAESGSTLSEPKYGFATAGGPNFGVLAGGSTDVGLTKTVDKYFYETSGVAPFVTSLEKSRIGSAGISDDSFGIITQGEDNNSVLEDAERYEYATDTTSPVGPFLSSLRYRAGVSGDGVGYLIGGDDGDGSLSSSVESFNFSDDSISLESISLPSARTRMASAESSDAGYLFGGNESNELSQILKLSFETVTLEALNSSLNIPRANAAAAGGTYRAVISGGGEENDTTRSSTETFDFGTHTASTGTSLTSSRKLHGSLSSSRN